MGKQLGTATDGKKEAGEQIEYTQEQLTELAKCAKDFVHFSKYVTIKTDKPTNPLSKCDFRPYQLEMADLVLNNRFCCFLSSRQSGKCCRYSVNINIRSKKDKIKKTLTIGEFYELCKNKRSEQNSSSKA